MLDYQALAAFAAVVREGSFERAALAIGVTPSAVSQRVRGLEERMGAVLVIRGQPCTATAIGARVCAHVEHVKLLEGEVVATLPALMGAGLLSQDHAMLRVAVNADSLGTWFLPAVAAFAHATQALLDLVIDGEEKTAEYLRSGEVLAAVTANAIPVQGCRLLPIGSLRYVATAAPGFARRYFPNGLTLADIALAPVLRFGHTDQLQRRWVQEVFGTDMFAPTHFVPSTQGFLDAALAALGWGMNPLCLAAKHIDAGRLVDLMPGRWLDVPLFWQHVRLGTKLLNDLTREVEVAARAWLVRA